MIPGNPVYAIAHSDFADFAYFAVHTKSTLQLCSGTYADQKMVSGGMFL